LADTLQCNIWRRAQKPYRMIHSLYGSHNGTGVSNGFTALGKAIGTPKSTDKDSAYVKEHPVLKYLRPKLANFLARLSRVCTKSAKSASGTLGAHFVLSKWYTNAYYMQTYTIRYAHLIHMIDKLCADYINT
jgi:hypothetical protein